MSFLDNSEKTRPSWLKLPVGLMGIALIVIAVKVTGGLASEALSKDTTRNNNSAAQPLSEDQITTVLTSLQSKIRSQLPIRVDPNTTWMDAIVVNKRISYIYSLSIDVPPEDRQAFIESVISSNRDNFCNNPGFIKVIESGGSVSWLYKTKSGEVVEAVLSSCP